LRNHCDQLVYLSGKLSLQGAACIQGSLLSAAVDEIGNGLCLGQVQLVIQVGALGKFSGTCLSGTATTDIL
jgi:hypothetical protein